MTEDEKMIAALLRERDAYLTRPGMIDRVAQVDDQLRLRGYDVSTLPARTLLKGDAKTEPPRERQSPRRSRA